MLAHADRVSAYFCVDNGVAYVWKPASSKANSITVRCRYNAVSFLHIPHNRHSTARPFRDSLTVWPLCAFLPLSPPGWRGIVVTVRAGGRAGGCQTCGTHISVAAWWIFSVRSSMELSRPLVVHCHAHLPICPIWASPWAKNLSNLPQIGSRLCGSHISETAGWIYPI